MARQLILVTILLVSLNTSYSRPQSFFSRRNQALGNGKFFNGRSQVSSTAKQAFARPNQSSVGRSLSPSIPTNEDIIEKTRTQTDTLKSTLKFLARKPAAAPILEKVLARTQNKTCINNMEDAIKAVETGTKLIENAGTELKLLVETVQEFQRMESVSEAVRQSAKIIRLLDVLIPKLTPASSACKQTSGDVIDSLHSLENLLADLSTNSDLYYTPQVRQSLQSSAQILSKATNLLAKESHFKFEDFCTKDRENNKEFLNAVANLMSDLAGFYADLEGDIAAEEIQKQGHFTRTIVVR